MAKTVSFRATFGVAEGYGHDNNGLTPYAAADVVAEVWQEEAARLFAETGTYVSAVVDPGRVVYHTDWGCPVGGEVVATVSGSANPAFVQDTETWRQTVVDLVKAVKARLGQTTVAIEFSEVDFIYLAD